jgi:hypothetical protein
LVRTVAKPFAGRLKDFLKDHDTARSLFSRLGQMLHKVEVRVAGNEQYLKVDKKGKSGIFEAKVKPLEEGKAVANGADFFAESIIFLIAGVCLTAEVKSSSKKEEQKKAALEKRFFDAEESIRRHKIQIESLTQELQLARQHVISLHHNAVGLMQVTARFPAATFFLSLYFPFVFVSMLTADCRLDRSRKLRWKRPSRGSRYGDQAHVLVPDASRKGVDQVIQGRRCAQGFASPGAFQAPLPNLSFAHLPVCCT